MTYEDFTVLVHDIACEIEQSRNKNEEVDGTDVLIDKLAGLVEEVYE